MNGKPMVEHDPYVGPRPFERADSGRFFGRDQQADELLSLVIANRAILLYAQSGAGKTSLINAQLIALLEPEGFDVFAPARVYGPAPDGIDLAQIPNIYIFNTFLAWDEDEADVATLAQLTKEQYLAAQPRLLDKYGIPKPRVLIIDQFEELFTTYPHRWRDRENFFYQIARALESDPTLRIIFSMREDYVAQLDPYVSLLPRNLRARFRLERMRPAAALLAVRDPLRQTDKLFAPGVAEQLVADLRQVRVESFTGETMVVVGEFVEPVQLQVVCQNLWRDLPAEVTTITADHLQAYGDVEQALSEFYGSVVRRTVQETKVKERQLREWFTTQLITPSGTRGTVYRGTVETGGIDNTAVQVMENAHLIRGEYRAGSRWYELTHDTLIEPIQQSNQIWWEQRRQQILRRSVAACLAFALLLLSGMSFNLLVRPAAGEAVTGLELTAVFQGAEAAIAASNSTATADISTREAIGNMTATAVAADNSTATANISTRIAIENMTATAVAADNSTATADISTRVAMANAMATAVAVTAINEFNLRSTEVAISAANATIHAQATNEVINATSTASAQLVATATAAADILATAQALVEQRSVLSSPRDIYSLAFSMDGEWLANGLFDGTLELRRVNNFSRSPDPIELRNHNFTIFSLSFSPDGQWLASASLDRTVRLWQMNNLGASPLVRGAGEQQMNWGAFSLDGQWLVGANNSGGIYLWDMNNLESEAVILNGSFSVLEVEFSPDGNWLASTHGNNTVRLWSVPDFTPIRNLPIPNVFTIAFSPTGTWLASGSSSGVVSLWNINELSSDPLRLDNQSGFVRALAFSPDGQLLAAAGEGDRVHLWDISELPSLSELDVLFAHEGTVRALAFSPDSHFLVAANDNNLRIWPVK